MAPPVVVITGHIRGVFGGLLQQRLAGSGWTVLLGSDDPAELARQLSRAVALVGGMGDTNAHLRATGEPLRLLQVPFVGTEWLDEAAVPPGVSVCNVHDQDVGISEWVLCQMLQWVCRTSEADALMRESCRAAAEQGADAGFSAPFYQQPPLPKREELSGKTLGIVGFGSIGRAVAARAAAFGMRLVATAGRQRPREPPLDWLGAGAADLDRLLRESDFVLLSCPITERTTGMIGGPQLELMRRRAVLINVSRGPVADEAALFSALREGKIGGAVLDVWWRSPDVAKRQRTCAPFSQGHPFHTLANVVMSPHTSGWTADREERTVTQVVDNLTRCLEGEPLCNLVYQRPGSAQ